MSKRSYRQNCALALSSDLIGERWSMLLIRDLLTGPRRFKDLVVSLQGIGTNLLATRLKDLEAAGIVMRSLQGSGVHAYELTRSGRALEPTLLALIRWGLAHGPSSQKGFHHMEFWDLLALKALFQPTRAGNISIVVQFTTPAFVGWVAVQEQSVSIGNGEVVQPDIVVLATIKQLFDDATAVPSVLEKGSRADLRRFMSAFK